MRLAKQARTVNVGDTERWASVAGGSALVLWCARKRTPAAAALAALGGDLIYRGATGRCHVYEALGISTLRGTLPYGRGIKLKKTLTVQRTPQELYQFWRNLENLPRFMRHIESVRNTGDKTSRWVVKAPGGLKIEWDAVIIAERENEMIGWRSLVDSVVDHAGSVRFEPAPAGRGTIVRVTMQYNPPAGPTGDLVARLMGKDTEQEIEEDLRRFKQLMEAREIPTTEGQPSGRDLEHAAGWVERDLVETASEDSFPASDAPAWAGVKPGAAMK